MDGKVCRFPTFLLEVLKVALESKIRQFGYAPSIFEHRSLVLRETQIVSLVPVFFHRTLPKLLYRLNYRLDECAEFYDI